MTQIISKLFLLVSFSFISLLLFVPHVGAQDQAIEEVCKNAPSSPVCEDLTASEDPLGGQDGLFVKVFNVLSIIGGIIAVIVIVIGGIQMMTADGDPQKFNNARNLMIYSVVGILIIFFSQAIVRLVVLTLVDNA